MPSGLIDPRQVHDHYLIGTRFRLRRVDAPNEQVFKLTQKVRLNPGSPERVRLTNTYLSAEEYDVFLALPATELAKTRWQSHLAGRPTAVDVFHGELDGLVLAETELREDEGRLPMPEGVSADVTDDDRFSGAALSRCSGDRLRCALVAMLGR